MKINDFEKQLAEAIHEHYFPAREYESAEEVIERARKVAVVTARVLAVVRHEGPLTPELLQEAERWEAMLVKRSVDSALRRCHFLGLSDEKPGSFH
ncbi:hypothetical protein HOP61_03015 [Halomonas daqingensis]|uniref:Uncharacterized protein n=1 Tax=Billgrantia desiderata TaxID=52021 RepID=A0AAW4YPD6_9GAMM|nr:hypothetical protein [Halomonas desiderata]MCE8050263.1 hypothetical protein [Halomonas desiderata]